jgi:PAS domain S-box-containing protein
MMIRLLQVRHYWLAPLLFWSIITGVSLAWNLARLDHSIWEIAQARGRIMYEMVRLTKIDPVLMVNDPGAFKNKSIEHIHYRVVSLKPKNPQNRADPWEASALSRFTKVSDFAFERSRQDGTPVFRYIRPIFMQQICLQCHGGEGVKVGDLRGGISVTVDAQPIYDSQQQTRFVIILMHVGGFLLLSLSTLYLLRQLRSHWSLLTQAQEQLRQKEQFLTDVTNTMGEGFVVIDSDGRVTYANPECEWLLGRSAADMLGRTWQELVYPAGNDAGIELEQTAFYKTLQDGMTRREDDEVFMHNDGLLMPVSYSVSALSAGQTASGVVLAFNDISERKRAEEERSRLERQLNQTHKMEAVGQLAGGIAHEINTPIQYIGDNLRFLKETYEDVNRLIDDYEALTLKADGYETLQPQVDAVRRRIEEIDFGYLKEESLKALEQSLSGAEQVARIVLAMKEFAHPGTRQMALADLNRIISNAVAVCRNEWKYVADTDLQLDPTLPQVECLGGELSQVVLNLIVNAAHAIEEAGREGKGSITVTSVLDGEWVEIRIADTGNGIPESVRDSIFNPFFTTKEVGRGTGQGLTIAQDIVVGKHHGALYFKTKTGVGTTFFVRLPLRQQASASQCA